MEILEYQVVMARTKEIEQEQFHVLEYVCKYLDYNINMNREAVQDKMLQLREEKAKLNNYINSNL